MKLHFDSKWLKEAIESDPDVECEVGMLFPRFICKAGASNNHPGHQADCDWPTCGCDPYANRVIDALEESGFEIVSQMEAVENE